MEEKTILHIEEMYDAQGGVNLQLSGPPENVVFPKTKSLCGLDTQRVSVWSGCFLFLDVCCCLVPWTVKLSYGKFMETGAV